MRTSSTVSLVLAASLLAASLLVGACSGPNTRHQGSIPARIAPEAPVVHAPLAASSRSSSGALEDVGTGLRDTADSGWIEFEIEVPAAGRWRTEVEVVDAAKDGATVWVEDRVENADGRTYDVTAPMDAASNSTAWRDGSPLDAGTHRMRLHHEGGPITVADVRFTLIREHETTPTSMTQSTTGAEWVVVWSDEFSGMGTPDRSKWTHDVGNWGWGNREPQYYTVGDADNARQEDGNLIIEARPNDNGQAWTSARLTTRGKVSFLRGRFEIRAIVPSADGTWAAGWMLGDDYRDEISWPYCGEVDVMEAVGHEIDDTTGDGINHASCHTGAFYFKKGNHLSNVIPVTGMSEEFHVYACEWDENEVRMYVDDVHYYTYDPKKPEGAWPFDRPQNLILNLAMGGGMGGEIAPKIGPQRVVVDYVRVLERR